MYGEEHLNNHHVLRYSLTKEFIEGFKSLKYLDIELPLTMILPFHTWIKPYVDKHLSNAAYIEKLKQTHKLDSMADVQKTLNRKPLIKRDLSNIPHRKTIVMPATLISFAIEQLPHTNVILMVSNNNDLQALQGKTLPQNITAYHLNQALKNTKVPKQIILSAKKRANQITQRLASHELFGDLHFKNWLERNILRLLKMIHNMEYFIRQKPIGLIMEQSEITIAGSTLSLMATKFNLPFINNPQVLLTDRNLIPTRASHYCCWGENYKKWLLLRGIPHSKIKVVGNARFEDIICKEHMSRSDFRDHLNIPEDHFVLTYTTQSFCDQVHRTIMSWIKEILSDSSVKTLPLTLIIKPHPFNTFDYSDLANINNVKILPKGISLYDLLHNSDFLMTISSNTAIEAAMFKKGIIILQPPIPYDYNHNSNQYHSHLVQASAGLPVYMANDLKKYITMFIQDEEFRSSLIKQGQCFLTNTLQYTQSPSILIRRLVQDLLNKHYPTKRKKGKVKTKN